MKCKERRQRIMPESIAADLRDYDLIRQVSELRRYDRIRYIRKDTGKYVKGGIVVHGDVDEFGVHYLIVQAFGREWGKCRKIRYRINYKDVILFRQKA